MLGALLDGLLDQLSPARRQRRLDQRRQALAARADSSDPKRTRDWAPPPPRKE